MHAPFDFLFDDDTDEDLLLLESLSRPRYARGHGQDGMINFYLSYSTITAATNTAAEISLLPAPDAGSTKTIIGNTAYVGQCFQSHFSGLMLATGAATLAVRLKLGTTLLLTAFAPVLPAIPATIWTLDTFLVVRAAGAGGSVQPQDSVFAFALNVEGATQWSGRAQGAAVPIDLSVDQDFALTAQWSAAAPGDSFQYDFGCINIVR